MADKIRDFFRRKKYDQKFKQAGPGHTLTEIKPVKKTNRPSPPKAVNQTSTDGARKAAEAAFARVEAHKKQNKIPNWSLAAVRAQAQKELELEVQAEKKSQSGPKVVSQESAPVLSVNGVFYNCPLVGPDVLSKREMQEKIKQFLYEQLEDEPGLTACLILHTCNPNKDKVKQGVETICKYLNNIIENPTEDKYHKIRMENRVFQDKVSCLEGALEFLLAAGFKRTSTPDGDFLIFDPEKLDELEYVNILKEALLSSEPIVPQLDRNTRVLLPLEAHAAVSLPNDFFNLSAEEIRREQEKKTEEVESNSVLKTKAMRVREAQKESRIYRFTLIRIKFSDGIILQGTFSVKEKLYSVIDFIKENLAEPSRPFQLHIPGGDKLDINCAENTLLEQKLIPAAILHLTWCGNNGEFSKSNDDAFLTPETMALLQSL